MKEEAGRETLAVISLGIALSCVFAFIIYLKLTDSVVTFYIYLFKIDIM